jgi:hypothetical protein
LPAIPNWRRKSRGSSMRGSPASRRVSPTTS